MIKVYCETCGKEFYVFKSSFKTHKNKYCSRKCYAKSKTNFNIIYNENEETILKIKSNKYGNFEVLIDEEDIQKVNKYNWFVRIDKKSENRFYVETFSSGSKERKKIMLHRYIMDCPDDMVVDHLNRNTLDNRKSNLRVCTQTENMQNRKAQKNTKLGIKNISIDKNKYVFQITRNKEHFRKRFKTLDEALNFKKQYFEKKGLL